MNTDQNGIVRNGFFSVVQIVISSLSYVIVYYMVLSRTGKAELGMWSLITSIPAAFTVFGSGVSGCLLRYIPVYIARGEPLQFNRILASGTLFNFILGLVISAAGYIFSEPIIRFMFDIARVPVLYKEVFHLTLITFFLNFISSVFLFSLDGLQLIYKRNIIIMAASVFFCICCLLFIPLMGLKGLLYAQTVQAAVIFFSAWIILKSSKPFNMAELRPDKAHIKLFFTYGQDFQYISLSILLFDPLTKYFLNRYFSLSAVGIYDIVNRAITQIRMVLVNAIQVIIPVVSKRSEEKSLDVEHLYSKALRGAAFLSILSYSILICISIPIVYLLDHKDLGFYIIFLVCLSFAYIINIIAAPAYSILMGLGKLNHIVISHLISTGLNIILFLLLQYKPLPEWMVLPPLFAISVSSFYILNQFHAEYRTIKVKVLHEDLGPYILSVLAVLSTILIYKMDFDITWLYILNLLYLFPLAFMLFRNTFLISLKGRLTSAVSK
ncbi:MAG TPA: MATE family efflux transporter [Sphingobacteriaceae bacterium]|nr:MATE family efflux transporter [Sphingobacteriaceae bacterium]